MTQSGHKRLKIAALRNDPEPHSAGPRLLASRLCRHYGPWEGEAGADIVPCNNGKCGSAFACCMYEAARPGGGKGRTASDCVASGVRRLDDGKSDPMTIAAGVMPGCAPQWNALSQLEINQMTTEKAQDYMRQQMGDSHEIELVTNAVLSYRAAKRAQQ
jgi:hypothetical protein